MESQSSSQNQAGNPLQRWANFPPSLALGLLTLTFFLGTWHLWTEFMGDTGYNLYTFWQLAEGKILHRDLTYFHGPLAPHVYGFLFWLFGTSLQTLASFNALLVFLDSWMIHRLAEKLFDRTTAWIAALVFLCAFAFSQNTISGNYNFISPYKPEIALGIFFFFLGLMLLHRWAESGKNIFLFFIGALWGCTLLLSAELCLASSAAVALTALFRFRPKRKAIAALGSGLLLPPLLSFLLLLRLFSPHEALRITGNALYFPFSHPEIVGLPFYRELAGLHAPGQSLFLLLKETLWVGLLLGAVLFLSRYSNRMRRSWLVAGGILLVAALLYSAQNQNLRQIWMHYPRAIPFFLFFFAAVVAKELWRSHEWSAAQFTRLAWMAFALALLQKMILNPTINFYGFFLAMPAALLLIGFFCSVLPRWASSRGWDGGLVRVVFCSLVLGLGFSHYYISSLNYALKSFYAGRGSDKIGIWSEEISDEGPLMEKALQWVEANVPAQSTLLMLPEGDIFNYLARRARGTTRTDSPFEHFALGEEGLLQEMQAHPPRFIGLIARNAAPYSLGVFGVDPMYGKHTLDWVKERYSLIGEIGGSPLTGTQIGVHFYRLN